MCGRYVTSQDIREMNEILEEVRSLFGANSISAGEMFPTNMAPVLLAAGEHMKALPMVWGFPQFKGSGVIINARAETAGEKKLFQSALKSRRCVIPSTGFYEWHKKQDLPKKEKYLCRVPGDEMLYMAGLYHEYEKESPRFVILTTAANRSMQKIHDRMPVILTKSELEDWSVNAASAFEILMRVPPELNLERIS